MTPRGFRDLCIAHHAARVEAGEANPLLSPGETFAFDMYRTFRDRPNAPHRTALATVLDPLQTQTALDVVRCRVAALEIAGTCDRETMDDWRAVEATLAVLHELLTGRPEQTQ